MHVFHHVYAACSKLTELLVTAMSSVIKIVKSFASF